MTYPDESKLRHLLEQLHLYGQYKQEYRAPGVEALFTKAEQGLQAVLEELQALPEDASLATQEPNDLDSIRRLRPNGPRRLWQGMDNALYREKLEGALLGRMAGCILGAPVEGTSIRFMEELARENEDPFPPVDYWKYVPQPYELRGECDPREIYTRTKMDGVPVDDDIAYTMLGLLVVEEYGPDFNTEDVGKAWLKYLPFAYTAEEITLKNLKAGIPALEAGASHNPFTEWIGADIRSDPWAYLAPGNPELAAEMAYRDACLSHRRQGIYGEMFFSAAIAAAFQVKDPLEAIQIGLTEIPAGCQLAQHVHWALAEAPRIKTYRQAREAVEQRFPGMSGAHTLNNACLTIFGLAIGKTDFSRVIGETVAMGLDNDCTAATAGSIAGAIVGKAGIPQHWYQNFNNSIHTYLIGTPRLAISDVLDRFTHQAARVYHRQNRNE
ncbi:MAG TPA: ADP-ribosylglycohydrolase family protein [Anaerolineaceae bacterium]|nr:ADP-ribosylglycohydrolase family protein [Anaerolineaceae bacterium]